MDNERSLIERFSLIETKLSDAQLLLNLGKANELPFFIFDLDTESSLFNIRFLLKWLFILLILFFGWDICLNSGL